MNRKEIFEAIEKERERQEKLHPYDSNFSNLVMNAVLVEEVGEVSKAILEHSNLEEEIIQVASVCVRWLENKVN